MIKNLLMIIIGLIFMAFTWHWSEKIYYQSQNIIINTKSSVKKLLTQKVEIKPAITHKMLIMGDTRGHFKGTVFINNIAMPFLIDTGATITTIPFNMAKKANLPFFGQYPVNTANGKAFHTSTRIEKLKIGYTELNNIEGGINHQEDNEVLIGMNTLKNFEMTINDNKMFLIAKNNVKITETYGSQPVKQEPQKIIHNWKKSVICNSNGEDCKTTYSE